MVSVEQAIQNFKDGLANDLRNALVRKAPVDTGLLKNSITVRIEGDIIKIYMPKYAIYLEYGTGIYGPLKRPITPKEAKALKFKIGGKTIFAKSIKGMTPQPFIRPVFHQDFIKIVNENAQMHLSDVDI